MPKVSVVMSVYNGVPYVNEAVESILSQTMTDFEFIIVNDASMDDSLKIIQQYDDARIRIINLEVNQGQTAALNVGLRQAQGDFIARQDADDRSKPERLTQQLAFLESNPDHLLLGTTADMIDAKGKITGFGARPYTDDEVRWAFANGHNYYYHGSVMFRREVLTLVGYYRTGFQTSQDHDYWLRVAEKAKVANLHPPALYEYRLHSGQMTYTQYYRMKAERLLVLQLATIRTERGDDRAEYEVETRALEEHFANFKPTRRQHRHAMADLWRGKGVFYLQAGRYLPMSYALLRAFLWEPDNQDFWRGVRNHIPGFKS